MNTHPENSDPASPPMANPRSELRNLRRNSSATVAELKGFLRQLQGKSPQEMLGIVAASQLVKAICISTVIVFAGGVIFTAIPFATGAGKKKAKAPAKESSGPTAAEPSIPRPLPGADNPLPGEQAANPDNPLTPLAPDLSTLGVTEEKQAPPNENPLENRKDNFLDGLE